MIKNSLISIIILNYNGGQIIQDCIESIYKTTKAEFEIILIDNNSIDSSDKECKEKFPQINLIGNNENTGMTARNIGIDNSKGDFIVFLDSLKPLSLTSLNLCGFIEEIRSSTAQ